MAEFFRRHLWITFLLHQAIIFALAVAFLTTVRRITGRTIHGGRDPVGFVDGIALVALSIGVIWFTRALYRWVKGDDARSLGIALSLRRFLGLLIGIFVGLAFVISPYIISLLTGTAIVQDRITAHFSPLVAIGIVAIGFFLLLLQSLMEETANRAFPMRLWEHRSLVFRIFIPSIFFAALHLADEGFGFARFGILLMAGVVQSLAYLLTGNVWFTSGVHAGANFATFSLSGLWHAGAIVSVVGQPSFPNWIAVMLMLAVFSVAFAVKKSYRERRSVRV